MLDSGDPWVEFKALAILGRADKHISVLLEELEATRDPKLKAKIVSILGGFGPRAGVALAKLRSLPKGESADLDAALAYALPKIEAGQPAATKVPNGPEKH